MTGSSKGEQRWRPLNLTPAFWRIIIFQVFVAFVLHLVRVEINLWHRLFTLVQVLACISTVIDIATHRPQPRAFGTQHIALLLAAWGPAIVFGKCMQRLEGCTR
ncbi:hypothetical protein AMATHDRAFT_150611 [Amanita thiersii Skay4041]|uniref:Uncharacterized protein n=1 Tax=Amanita thiersii Skay4041 TaxID=703135 RepID=A0A2A9NIH0_9AGAR|nr:hypothetical protein AMATHDRAFT_150611 [Amanita thiersii Skay4041]